MDTGRAELLIRRLTELVDLPPYDYSQRVLLSVTLAAASLHFAASVRTLCEAELTLGAASTLRSQYEALVRGVWVAYCANDSEVELLSAPLSEESQRVTKDMPRVADMLRRLAEHPQLANLLISLNEFKGSSWLPLNSFVHSGIHAVHWTKAEPSPLMLDQLFRISNGLTTLAFQNVAILTGRPGLQSQIIHICADYPSCLPAPREQR